MRNLKAGISIKSTALLNGSFFEETSILIVEHDEAGKDKAISICGKQSIPVIAFSDGTFMVEPSDIDLKKKLEELSAL